MVRNRRYYAASRSGIAVSHLGDPNGSGDAQEFQDPDLDPGKIELIPRQTMPRRSRMGVVIVVPAFAEGDQRDPPVIAGIVARVEAARAPHVRDGVDQPGGVQADDDAQADAPQHQRKAAEAYSSAASTTIGTQ